MFLLASVGAFYAARTDRWAWAGAAAAAASATRSAGIVLLLPLALFWWQSQPRRLREGAWLLLAPLGLVAYVAFLGLSEGDGLRFLQVQDAWSREFAGPFLGAWDGLVAAVDGVRQFLSGSAHARVLREGRRRPLAGGGHEHHAAGLPGAGRGRHGRRLAAPAAPLRASTSWPRSRCR